MSKKHIESTVGSYLEPLMEQFQYEAVDVEYVKEGSTWYLRVYIDKPGGITVLDCEKVSRALEIILDEKDPIQGAYILEVSSPGLDRPLKKEADFNRVKGQIIEIKLFQARDKQKEYQGELQDFKDNVVTIVTEEDETISFDLKDIAIARLAIIF